jgi:hypothetical protein
MIPADAIERARQADLLSEAMRLGARLKRIGGGEYAGPCPACGGGDRFSVNTRKKVWHCRGCGRGGDVVDLIQHVEGVTFIKAVETLAGEERTAPKAPRTGTLGDLKKGFIPPGACSVRRVRGARRGRDRIGRPPGRLVLMRTIPNHAARFDPSHRPCLDTRTVVYHDGLGIGAGRDFDESETSGRGRKRGRDGELRDACRSVGRYCYRGAAGILH